MTLKRRCWALYRGQRKVGQRTVDLDTAAETHLDPTSSPTFPCVPTSWPKPPRASPSMRSRLAKLKPQERQALGLLALGYSYREICELTGWTFTKVNRCLAEGEARSLTEER